jgi:hypothetical protein
MKQSTQQQHKEALGNRVKSLTKEKKEKENVQAYLELVNQKNIILLQFEEIRKKQQRQGKISCWRNIRSIRRIYNTYKHS